MRDRRPIINITRGTVVCEKAELADGSLQRMRGLLGRKSLPAGDGLLLQPAPSIHTAFMRFAIDAVFLDRDSVVVKVVDFLAPWRAASARQARSVLELAAGESGRRGVQIGDRLVRVSEDPTPAYSHGDRRTVDVLAADAQASNPAAGRRMPLPPPEGTCPGSGGPEVLLVSADRRFRAVMAALLTTRGFTVTISTRYADMATAGRTHLDVVVIDAGDSLAPAEEAATQAGLMSRELPVIFVSDGSDACITAACVIPKWESFDELCDKIESARSEALGEISAWPAPEARGAVGGSGT
jgi:uncharacterized protein